VNVENIAQSKQWMHIHSPNKPKKVQTSDRNFMATVFWDRNGVLMVKFMHQGGNRKCQNMAERTRRRLDTGIQKLILRYDKFLNSVGDYVEK
jgi:hypothetical protein